MPPDNVNDRKLDPSFKPTVVWLILNQKTEEALSLLAKAYNVTTPRLKMGLPKGHTHNIYGCYTPKDATISLLNSEMLGNPFVIIHEFYHHLRTSVDKQHKGTEKNADKFANDFITAYNSAVKGNNQA